jgi:hypothetical protein
MLDYIKQKMYVDMILNFFPKYVSLNGQADKT